ncbi:hypothetical protein EP331_14100 [bacterium]|nr:MAG: hypothetical protein EP331_14100 [bacterium]
MTPLFKKLNFKAQSRVHVLNHPEEFETELQAMSGFTGFSTSVSESDSIDFVMIFVTQQSQIDSITKRIISRLKDDAVLWFCYPKGSSKKYSCDFNRDNGWTFLGNMGFESVRMVAIDENWSALRFRHVSFIKTLNRDAARRLT